MDDVGRLALSDRHVQRVKDELGFQTVPHSPADDPAGESIEHDGQIQEPGPGRHVGDVGNPENIRRIGIEVPVNQIAGRTDTFVAECGPERLSGD